MSMIINKLLAAWHTKTPAQKAKTIFHGIIMIGGGVIGNTIGDKCSAGRGRVQSACARVTGWALGGAVADVAAKSMDETIDAIDMLAKSGKKAKEDAANA